MPRLCAGSQRLRKKRQEHPHPPDAQIRKGFHYRWVTAVTEWAQRLWEPKRGTLHPFVPEGFPGGCDPELSRASCGGVSQVEWHGAGKDAAGRGSDLSCRMDTRHCWCVLANYTDTVGGMGRWAGAQNGGRHVAR